MSERPVGVLLLNMGAPESVRDVPAYLRNLFQDPDLFPLPLGGLTRPVFARLLARLRAPKARAAYRRIGGGSPLARLTRLQADALREALRARGLAAAVEPAMRHWRPTTAEALDALERAGASEIVVALPLYPHFSAATTGSCARELERELARRGRRGPCAIVAPYGGRPLYLAALERRIRETIASFPAGAGEAAEILFSAHGLPESFAARGDPYPAQIQAAFDAVRARFPGRAFHLAYQSRVGPLKWIGPHVEDKIAEIAGRGAKSLLVVAVSFVSDNLETLDEIDIRLARLARETGIEHFRRAPAFNDAPDFIELLAQLILETLAR